MPAGRSAPGVGIYVDAKPRVAAVRMDIRTPTPGWSGDVFVAEDRVPEATPGADALPTGWKNVGHIGRATRRTSVDLDTAGNSYRYYLVWITELPADEERAQIAEIDLFRRKG